VGIDGGSQAVVAPLFLELLAAAEVLGRRHASRADNPQQLVEVPGGEIKRKEEIVRTQRQEEKKSNHVCETRVLMMTMKRASSFFILIFRFPI
jgi:hypothetical protein